MNKGRDRLSGFNHIFERIMEKKRKKEQEAKDGAAHDQFIQETAHIEPKTLPDMADLNEWELRLRQLRKELPPRPPYYRRKISTKGKDSRARGIMTNPSKQGLDYAVSRMERKKRP